MKRTFLILSLVLIVAIGYGQRKPTSFGTPLRSNITVSLRGGAGALLIDNQIGEPTDWGFNTGVDIGYTFFKDPNWGLHAGVNVVKSTSGFSANQVESETIGTIEVYDGLETYHRTSHLTATTSSVNEEYQLIMLELPVQLAFQYDHVYFNFGLTTILPLSFDAHYSYGPSSLGYGHEIDGIGTNVDTPIPICDIEATSGDYSLLKHKGIKPVWMSGSIEGGYRFPISKHHLLCLGLYADFSIVKSQPSGDGGLVTMADGMPVFNACASSQHIQALRYVTIGVKAKYIFSFGKKVKAREGMFETKPPKKPRDPYHGFRKRVRKSKWR